MHVEVSVALNFVISYLYNKLPRRRVDLLGVELEKGLKKKFEGHWYPDKPFKGSGFRCVRVNGEKIDPVIIKAACDVGLNLEEMKEYLPNELTVWIDPSEVSYRIGEKGQIKILYSDRNTEDSADTETDQEVQATNRGFNPEAQIFNPDAQSFKPIDILSSSLGSLSLSPVSGLSPSSPISSSSWAGSQSTSPSGGALFPPPPAANTHQYGPKGHAHTPMFTTASFAQTKFGSTKLKTNAKRPTRLSPTEFGNFFRQKAISGGLQHPGLASPTRARSLSPRDPRVEFIVDQQQRMLQSQQQQQIQQQFHQQQLHLQQQQQQQQLNYQLYHQQQLQQQQQSHSHYQHNRLSVPTDHHMGTSGHLHDMFSGPSPLQSPLSGQTTLTNGQSQLLPGISGQQSPLSSPEHSPVNPLRLSQENHKSLLEGLGLSNVPYSTGNHHLLLAS